MSDNPTILESWEIVAQQMSGTEHLAEIKAAFIFGAIHGMKRAAHQLASAGKEERMALALETIPLIKESFSILEDQIIDANLGKKDTA